GPEDAESRYRLTSAVRRHQFFFVNPLSSMWVVFLVANHAVLNFKFCRRRAYVDDLVRRLHELVEIKRTSIERAWQAKAVIYQYSLARTVAFMHPADLRDGCMRLVDHNQKIFREKVDDGVGLRARRAA